MRADERVFGVWTGSAARAYPLADLARAGLIPDDLGGPLVVLREPETKAAAAYRPVASQPRKYKAPAPDKDGISKPDEGVPAPPGTAVQPPRKGLTARSQSRRGWIPKPRVAKRTLGDNNDSFRLPTNPEGVASRESHR